MTFRRLLLATLCIGCFAIQGLRAQAGKTLTFGFVPGPYSDLFKTAVQPGLVKKGYRIQIREFSDYVQPDLALGNGGIDANLFQHTLYLTQFAKDHNLKLAPVISVPTAGQGLYSHKIKSIDALKRGDVVTLSNDATNLALPGQARPDHLQAGHQPHHRQREGHRPEPPGPGVQAAGSGAAAPHPGQRHRLGDQRQLRHRRRHERA
jgi:hypothetical protein